MDLHSRVLKVGLVGRGAIGLQIEKAVKNRFRQTARLAGIYDADPRRRTVASLDGLISKSDIVVEAASKEIAPVVAKKALLKGRQVLVMSVGGLIGRADLLRLGEKTGGRLYIPSGALCGLDSVRAAAVGRIRTAALTTIKPPRALEGAPYIIRKKIDLSKIKRAKLIFKGNVYEAVRGFPQNINVAAALAMAGIGPARTEVRIVADPAVKRNIHQIVVEGDFGKVTGTAENVPSKENPKTSQLAVNSAIATLGEIINFCKANQ